MNALERRIGQRRGATRAPTQAPEWRGRLRAAPEKSDPPIHNLLGPKNGLDNGVHFSERRQIFAFGCFFFIQATKALGAVIVDSRLWRTSDQSSNS